MVVAMPTYDVRSMKLNQVFDPCKKGIYIHFVSFQ